MQSSIDDVSHSNHTTIAELIYPKNTADVSRAMTWAHSRGLCICPAGTRHSMGGQSIVPHGVAMDTKHMKGVSVIFAKGIQIQRPDVPDSILDSLNYKRDGAYLCGAGDRWCDVMMELNKYELSPHTMQSYCSFSVGGTLAVNAHGITSDTCMGVSVHALEVALPPRNGEERSQIEWCTSKTNNELFSHVIGGYGLCGIICRCILYAIPNQRFHEDSVKYPIASSVKSIDDLVERMSVRDPVAPRDIRIGRVDIYELKKLADNKESAAITLIHMRARGDSTVSKLPKEPRGTTPGVLTRLAFYLAERESFRLLRSKTEKITQTPIDWNYNKLESNSALFENAELAAQESGTIQRSVQILQEYFLPINVEKIAIFLKKIKHVLGKFEQVLLSKSRLLNITIRVVQKDTVSALPYARQDVIAFVLFWRVVSSSKALKHLATAESELINEVLRMGGSFYLPYRLTYDFGQLQKAYTLEALSKFVKYKKKIDEAGTLQNTWSIEYFPYIEGTARSMNTGVTFGCIGQHAIRPSGVFKRLFASDMRSTYFSFLKSKRMETIIETIETCLKQHKNDEEIYAAIRSNVSFLKGKQMLTIYAKGFFILRKEERKKHLKFMKKASELLSNTAPIVIELGGESNAKYWRSKLNARVTSIYPKAKTSRNVLIADLYGSDPFGSLDMNHNADIVASFIGLHHFPNVAHILEGVYQALRPGGIFVCMEHDASVEWFPLLDAAHMTFNALTKEDWSNTRSEYRAFRTSQEWILLLRKYGFHFELELKVSKDETNTNVMYFRKPAKSSPEKTRPEETDVDIIAKKIASAQPKDFKQLRKDILRIMQTQRDTYTRIADQMQNDAGKQFTRDESNPYFSTSEWAVVDMVGDLNNFLKTTPFTEYPYFRMMFAFWKSVLISVKRYMKSNTKFRPTVFYNLGMSTAMLVVVSTIYTFLGVTGSFFHFANLFANWVFGAGVENIQRMVIFSIPTARKTKVLRDHEQTVLCKIADKRTEVCSVKLEAYSTSLTDLAYEVHSAGGTLLKIAGSTKVTPMVSAPTKHIGRFELNHTFKDSSGNVNGFVELNVHDVFEFVKALHQKNGSILRYADI